MTTALTTAPTTITPTEMAWMAAVIDMRGKTRRSCHVSRRTPLLMLYVESRHLPVLRRLGRYSGSRIEVEQAKALPASMRKQCAAHCPDAHQHVQTVLPEIGRWHISGAGAAVVLHNLLPMMMIDLDARKDFVRQVYAQVPMSGRGRHAIDQSLNRLRRLGWEIPPQLMPPVDAVLAGAA